MQQEEKREGEIVNTLSVTTEPAWFAPKCHLRKWNQFSFSFCEIPYRNGLFPLTVIFIKGHVPKGAIYSTWWYNSSICVFLLRMVPWPLGGSGFRALTEQRTCFSVSKSFDRQSELGQDQPMSFSQNYPALWHLTLHKRCPQAKWSN